MKDGCLTFVKKQELQTVQYVVLIVDSDKKEACGEEYKILQQEQNWSHCKENSIYVFPKKKLRSLNFHINVSVSDLYIPPIGPPFFMQQTRQTDLWE